MSLLNKNWSNNHSNCYSSTNRSRANPYLKYTTDQHRGRVEAIIDADCVQLVVKWRYLHAVGISATQIAFVFCLSLFSKSVPTHEIPQMCIIRKLPQPFTIIIGCSPFKVLVHSSVLNIFEVSASFSKKTYGNTCIIDSW